MRKRKNLLLTGVVVAILTVSAVSVFASGDVIEDTVEAVQEKMGFGHRGGKGQEGGRGHEGEGFSKAVEAEILTEEQADAIIEYHEANRPDKDTIDLETEGMTREERQAYMEENYPRPEDPLAELVEAGLLTQEQADQLEALKEEMDLERPERGEGGKGQREDGQEFGEKGHKGDGFSKAVEAGILNEEQADAISEYHEANRPDKDAIDAETDGMTREEKQAYMEENYPRPEDPLAELVEAGLITQEQADQLEVLKAEMDLERPERGEGGEGHKEGGRGRRP